MPVELVLKGRVQGVGCRYYCSQVARRLNISATASNKHDGSVSVILETENSDLVRTYVDALENNRFRISFFGSIREITQRTYSGHPEGDYEW